MIQEPEEANLTETIERLKQIFIRRRWWILSAACGVILAVIGVLRLIPNRYTSEATVLVIQQTVPERYVTPTSTTDISQALQGMTQEVLSRTRLLSIIDDLNLYPKEKKRLAPEELIERMRHDIDILPLESNPERRTVNAFRISFISENPQRAQEVTSRLTSLFIEENVKTREHQATATTNFLQEQLEAAKKQLTEQEERLRVYKMQHLGELPEQQGGNVQILAGLSTQLDQTMGAISRAQEQKVYLESLLRGLVARSSPGAGTAAAPVPALVTAAQDTLTRLQAEKANLLSVYTPDHPDVARKDKEISKAEAALARLKSSAKDGEAANAQTATRRGEHPEEDGSVGQVKSQLEANRLELEHLTKDQNQLKAQLSQYQDRLNATPIREQQLAGMLRDYELLKQNYADLLGKRLQSQLAMSLEKHQEGQQFRLVDAPSLPIVPSSPKRMKISLGGVAAGILLGFALALLIDTRDRSFHTEKEMSHYLKLPMVVAVPLLLTPREDRVRGWKKRFEWCAGTALVLAVVVAEFFVVRAR